MHRIFISVQKLARIVKCKEVVNKNNYLKMGYLLNLWRKRESLWNKILANKANIQYYRIVSAGCNRIQVTSQQPFSFNQNIRVSNSGIAFVGSSHSNKEFRIRAQNSFSGLMIGLPSFRVQRKSTHFISFSNIIVTIAVKGDSCFFNQ